MEIFYDCLEYFGNHVIGCNKPVSDNFYEIFNTTQKFYLANLRESIQNHLKCGAIPAVPGKSFYNYLIIDGKSLLELLEKIDDTKDISTQILEAFKKTILYVGKGIKGRKLDHLVEGKKIILKQLKLSKICAKYSKITQIWERGHGIVCLQIFGESDHFEAHCKEFAIIKAIGLNNLTNVNSGLVFGDMKDFWNSKEVENFGNMILYNTLKMCVSVRPVAIYKEDIITKVKDPKSDDGLWELRGILEYFLDM